MNAHTHEFQPSRSRGDLARDIDRALSGESMAKTVPLLCAKLRELIGNPDLVAVIQSIEDIHDAEAQAHWEAASELAVAAKEICENHLIN